MRFGVISSTIIFASSNTAAQTFATSEQPVPEPAPVYQAYEPATFNAEAYESAPRSLTAVPLAGEVIYEPLPYDAGSSVPHQTVQPLPLPLVQNIQPSGDVNVYHSGPNDPLLGDNLSQPLGAPETFASPKNETFGAIGFSEETETSRLLLALEETYATRVAELKVQHLAQRRAMLGAFEKEAADPNKVIGLAGRMRSGLAELEAAQDAVLAEEERQYTAALLSVLDRAPLRVE